LQAEYRQLPLLFKHQAVTISAMDKIVIDARELNTSSGRYVERLLFYLQKIDNNHKYQVLLRPADMEGWNSSNPNFEKIVSPYKEFTLSEQSGLKSQVEALRPKLTHFTFTQQPIRFKGKAITTVHDLTTARFNNPAKNFFIFKFKQQVYKYVIKKVAHKSERIIVPSKYVKDDLVSFSGINASKVSVIYESADLIKEGSEEIKELSSKKFLMYIGRPTPHKNLNRLIDAFAIVREKHPETWLVLAGKKDVNYMKIEEGVLKKDLNNILFTGFVSEGQLKWLYENCAAYVFPSLSEGFGLPGLEAMVCGAPVISSKATCLPEVYGEAAHYFDPLDIKDMARSISDVLQSEGLRQSLINKGRNQAKKYSWQRTAVQTLKIYEEELA
jgi:glycosyltransferase involved in cell wall biosynthesis